MPVKKAIKAKKKPVKKVQANKSTTKKVVAKKISKPGRVLSSGVKQNQSDVSLKAKREKLSRLKKSGSVKDAASIFLDMINNK